MPTSLLFLIARARAPRRDDRGSVFVEYALLVSFIAVACIGSVRALGLEVSETFQRLADAL